MLAEVCQAYGWTLDYVLNMPASQFYIMAKEARFMRYRQLVDLCDIAPIGWADQKYFETIRKAYIDGALGIRNEDQSRQVPDHIATQPDFKIPEMNTAMKHARLCDLFAAKKGLIKNG